MKTKLTITSLSVLMTILVAPNLTAQTCQGPQPNICTRACWGARAPACDPGTMGALNRAIIHHTGFTGGGDWATTGLSDSAAIIRGIQNGAIAKGWCDVSYHFIVDK